MKEVYIPRQWWDETIQDLDYEKQQYYWNLLEQIHEDWNAMLEESTLFQEWKEEYGATA